MTTERAKTCLSAIFVDYDNIYLSLRRKNEEAAKRFAKDAALWVNAISSGELLSSDRPGPHGFGGTAGEPDAIERRIVMNRCYGNPVPRRNATDNATDMSCFPFVRHHFVRTGAEIIDCPPLTAQLKNSSDIRMVMDMRDMLNHATHLDEFVILSGDADFTPVLTRLRAHARRTVIYTNEQTAQAYTSLADARINESDLITLLMSGETNTLSPASNASVSDHIISEVMKVVDGSNEAVPIETLADRAQRALGHEQTVGTSWAGYGGFLALLKDCLPDRALLASKDNSYTVADRNRQAGSQGTPPEAQQSESEIMASAMTVQPETAEPAAPHEQTAAPVVAPTPQPVAEPVQVAEPAPAQMTPPPLQPVHPGEEVVRQFETAAPELASPTAAQAVPAPMVTEPPQEIPQPAFAAPTPLKPASNEVAAPAAAIPAPNIQIARNIQESITRIHEASQAPALSHTDYQVLFGAIAQEITENGINGTQTVTNVGARAHNTGLNIKANDVRFILNVIGEADPWFQQGTSPALFASRFQNFVIARCRSMGLQLSMDELELIQTWFTAGAQPEREQAADAEWQQQENQEATRTQQQDAAPSEGLPQFLNRAQG